MKNILSTALAALLFCAPAFADQAPETPLFIGPAMQQVPASQILIKVPGSTIQTLGAALAASGCTTNCTLFNPTITGGSIAGASVAATTLSATGASTTAGITDSGGITTTTLGSSGAATFGTGSTNGVSISGGSGATLIKATGSSAQLLFQAGNGAISYFANANNQPVLRFNDAGNGAAVNYATIANAATGGNPSLTVIGSDTNPGFNYNTQGAGQHIFNNEIVTPRLNLGGANGNGVGVAWSGVSSNSHTTSPFWLNVSNWSGTSSIAAGAFLNMFETVDNLAATGTYVSPYHFSDTIGAAGTAVGGRQVIDCNLGFSAGTHTYATNGGDPFFGCGQFTVGSAFNEGGTSISSAVGHMFGASTQVSLLSGATFWNELTSFEGDVELMSGASANFVTGFKAVNLGSTAGLGGMDTAFSCQAATQKWDACYAVGYGAYGTAMKTTGTGILFAGPQTPSTGQAIMKWGIDGLIPSFTSGFARSVGFQVDGSGNITHQTDNVGQFSFTPSASGLQIAAAGERVTTYTIGSAGTGATPGDMVTDSVSPVPGVYQVATTSVASATVNAGGSGGTNGTQTVTGTTGTGTKFQASVTVSGGAITAVLSISVAGSYTANPAANSAEPVTGASLVGAKLAVAMQTATVTQLVADVSSAHLAASATTMTPTNGSAVGGSSITGLSLNLTSAPANDVTVGLGSALATTTTTGFLHLPFTTAAPTGTPANTLPGCAWNTGTHTLNCYDGSAWYHIAGTSGAG